MSSQWLAAHLRSWLAAVDWPFAWLVDEAGGGATYAITRWVFLRALGVIYLVAFLSFWVQAHGLFGARGILPLPAYLRAVATVAGTRRYRVAPAVFWMHAGDRAVHAVCGLGVASALLLVLGVAPLLALVLLWTLYLSLVTAGQDFMAFQWDSLLLEAGLLAVLLVPWQLLPAGGPELPVPAFALFLLWWLLFRLTFQSGVVKLTWGDPTWWNLTALHYHFFAQPLPTWLAWYADQLPSRMKKAAVLATYVLEIGFPLLIFGTRGMRLAACAGTIFLQLLIQATGNYNFFNLLTITLSLLLLDDTVWGHVLPAGLMRALPHTDPLAGGPPAWTVVPVAFGLGHFALSTVKFAFTLTPGTPLPRLLARVLAWLEPFRSINSYGLFRVMTTTRPEILVEGSDDGKTWEPYEFRYKPGDPTRRPRFVEPHQPRLDWQMWFAALARYETTPWFGAFLLRLLDGSPAVRGLLAPGPFQDRPPRYVRALVYDYRFSTRDERRTTGAWWTRTELGRYTPVLTLRPETASRVGNGRESPAR